MRSSLLTILFGVLLVGFALGQASTPTDTASSSSPASNDSTPKKPKAKAKHIFTNEDIPERPSENSGSAQNSAPVRAPAASTPASGDPGPTATDSSNKDGKTAGGDKNSKAEAIKAAQAKVDGLKHDESAITGIVQHIEKMIAEGGEFRRNAMSEGLQKQQSDLADIQKKREAAEQDLQNLQNPPK